MSQDFSNDPSIDREVASRSVQQEAQRLDDWTRRVDLAKELLASPFAIDASDGVESRTQFEVVNKENERVSYYIGCETELGGSDAKYWIAMNLAPVDSPAIFFNAQGPIQPQGQRGAEFEDLCFGSDDGFARVDMALAEGFQTLAQKSSGR